MLARTPTITLAARLAFKKMHYVQRIVPIALLFGGMGFVLSGFILSLECPTCGTMQLLLGVAPSLAGGYHLYCLESREYVSEQEAQGQIRFCLCLYVVGMLVSAMLMRWSTIAA